MALDGVRHAWARAGNVDTLRLHGDCHLGNVLWTDDDRISSISTTAAWGRRYRIYGCCSRASGWRCRCNCRTSSPATGTSATSTGANASRRGIAHAQADPLCRLDRQALG